jgi:hypothetical protein
VVGGKKSALARHLGQKQNRGGFPHRDSFEITHRAIRSTGDLADDTNALSERSTLASGDVEFDALTLKKGATSVCLNFTEVNENVRLAIAGDEAEALLVVEPLYGADCHCSKFSSRLLF